MLCPYKKKHVYFISVTFLLSNAQPCARVGDVYNKLLFTEHILLLTALTLLSLIHCLTPRQDSQMALGAFPTLTVLKDEDRISSKSYTNIQFVPHRKHYASAIKTNRLMLFRELIAVYCENHIKHKYSLWAESSTR
jgi:hypothetical protein